MELKKSDALREQVLRTSGVDVRKCMRCGKCTATCPAFDAMEYHPHQFVYMVERGEIEKERHESYLSIYADLAQKKPWDKK